MILDYCYFSEKGIRAVNQDSVFATEHDDNGLFLVADGMGGHSRGEYASQTVVQAVQEWWQSVDGLSDIDRTAESCAGVLNTVTRQLYEDYSRNGEQGGTTTVLLLVNKAEFRILSVGDSRVYRFSFSKFEQLNEDDVWENLPEIRNTLSKEEIASDQRLGRLTAAVGGYRELSIRITGGTISRMDGFLLCSDGIYKPCGDKKLKKILCGKLFSDSRKLSEKIRDCAVKNDTQDNFSAIVCRITRG